MAVSIDPAAGVADAGDAGTLPSWIAGSPDGLVVASACGRAMAAGLLRPATRLASLLHLAGRGAAAAEALDGFLQGAARRGRTLVRTEIGDDDRDTGALLAAAGFHVVPASVHAAQPPRRVVRLERHADGRLRPRSEPFYAQTTPFSCGGATVMLAAGRLGHAVPLDRRQELLLWRQANTVHAPNGPGGCDPFGVACATARLGLHTRVLASADRAIMTERVLDAEKRALMVYVQAAFRAEAASLGVAIDQREWHLADLRTVLAVGGVAIVLIDLVLMHRTAMPHWVLVHGIDGDDVILDNTWVEPDTHETDCDAFSVPVPAAQLDRMGWYGAPPYRAAVLLSPKETAPLR